MRLSWQSSSALFILALVAVAIGHDLTYVLTHGNDQSLEHALREGGHSAYWSSFVLTTVIAAAALVAVAAVQLRRLDRQAHLFGDRASIPDRSIGIFVGQLCRWWLGLSVTSLGVFFVQENVERLAAGTAPPLLGAIAGDHWLAVPIFAVISLALAAVAALVRWRRIVLLTRLSGPRRHWPRVHGLLAPIADLAVPVAAAESRAHGLRAPPAAQLLG